MLIGLGTGIVRADLENPNRPREDWGTKLRVHFDLGYEVRPWLELGADLGFGMLGESDSLNAVLASRGADAVSHVTLVNAGAVVRARWLHGSGRWAPFVRAGAGGVTVKVSAPLGLGGFENDWAWNAGGGLEVYAHRRLVLRAEALDLAQAGGGGTRHHAAVGLTVLYAVSHSALGR